MINFECVKRFCRKENIHLIPNYLDAIHDETQVWDCHHILEVYHGFDKKSLIKKHLYYGCNPEALIFLTRREHSLLHDKMSKCTFAGLKHTDETKRKQSEAHKKYWAAHPMTPETRAKISAARRAMKKK